MSVTRAQQEISAAEFSEWLAYAQLNPIGEQRADLRAGIIASVVASALSGKHYKPGDFMPRFGEEQKDMSPEVLMTILQARGMEFKHA